VQKHPEPQIDKLLLQIEQRSTTPTPAPIPTRWFSRPTILLSSERTRGKHSQRRRFGG
jgi:hypothetical protein